MSENQSTEAKRNQDTFKILVATDNHLGYECKTKRAQENDSLITFEEILKLAVDKNVDFILLGGDLFHDAKPSQRIILECLKLLKKYCLGKRLIPFEFLSNPDDIFPNKSVNYEDENMNVSMPVFSIHGNHDNPSFESTGTLDLLNASGLINYFGKWSNLQDIKVTPMIFRKGTSLLAIYGLGHISEQRLSRLLREGKVEFLRPKLDNCFSILVIHQNRAKHAENEYIEEGRFPGWLDLVIWGHEHECKIAPEQVASLDKDKYFICQPGSSVATSLSEGEAVPKHVGLLRIRHQQFRMFEQKLQTVRPFIFRDIYLSEIIERGYCDFSSEGITEYIDDYIEKTAIAAGKKMLTGHPNQPQPPLIRLRIFHTQDHQVVGDMSHLSHKYHESVANASDMIAWKKEKSGGQKRTKNDHFEDLTEDIAECFRHNPDDPQAWTRTVQSGITKYFEKNDHKLKVLSLAGINEAVKRCVENGDDDAFASVMEHQIRRSIDYLMTKDVATNSDAVVEELAKYREERNVDGEDDELRDVMEMLNDPAKRSKLKENLCDLSLDDGSTVTPKGRGRGRGSRARGASTRGSTRGRGKAALDITVVPDVSPVKKVPDMFSKPDTSAFKRFAAPSSQRNNTSTQGRQSQRPQFIHNSDSDSD